MLGIFLDCETNGLDFFVHKVLSISFKIIDLKTSKELAFYEAQIFRPHEVWQQSTKESFLINGLHEEDQQHARPEKEVVQEIKDIFFQYNVVRKKAVFICQNPSFDRTFFSTLIPSSEQERLLFPYHWLDLASMYWIVAHSLTPDLPFVSKNEIASLLGLPTEATPHTAKSGVEHLVRCYFTLVSYTQKLAKEYALQSVSSSM